MNPTESSPSNDPLHGITLKNMLTMLVEQYGWDALAQQIHIRCFVFDPSIASSLKFLRRTPWARKKVERLYLIMLEDEARKRQRTSTVLAKGKKGSA